MCLNYLVRLAIRRTFSRQVESGWHLHLEPDTVTSPHGLASRSPWALAFHRQWQPQSMQVVARPFLDFKVERSFQWNTTLPYRSCSQPTMYVWRTPVCLKEPKDGGTPQVDFSA